MLRSTVIGAPLHQAPEIDSSVASGALLLLILGLLILRARRA